jgi:DNA-binding MarR family transcriptional regulator
MPLPEGLTREAVETLSALRFAAKAMRQQADRWAEQHDLSEGRLHLLFRLRRAPGHQLALHLLANVLDVSPRNITGLVDHLEKDGLIERVPDSTDRRSIQARLTAAALKKMDRLWKESTTSQVSILKGFSTEELGQFRDFCYRLVENMAKAEQATGSKEERK